MIQRCQQLGLALEAGQPFGIVAEDVGQHLDGDLAAEFRVLGAVDYTHSARAEFFCYSVVKDGFPGQIRLFCYRPGNQVDCRCFDELLGLGPAGKQRFDLSAQDSSPAQASFRKASRSRGSFSRAA